MEDGNLCWMTRSSLLPDGVRRAYRVVMKHAALIAALFPTIPEKRLPEAEERFRQYLAFIVRLVDERSFAVPTKPPLTADTSASTLDTGRTFTSHHNDTET